MGGGDEVTISVEKQEFLLSFRLGFLQPVIMRLEILLPLKDVEVSSCLTPSLLDNFFFTPRNIIEMPFSSFSARFFF